MTHHVWEHYMEECEDFRNTIGFKEIYACRKEIIERIFSPPKKISWHALNSHFRLMNTAGMIVNTKLLTVITELSKRITFKRVWLFFW